jgi:hypothetical protein
VKPILLIACFAFFSTVSAQEFKVDVPKIMKHSNVFKQLNTPKRSFNRDSLIQGLQNFFTTKHHPGMYYLPQDNMPCLVPDTEDVSAMPNVWPQPETSFKSAMPNPGFREKPLIERPKDKTK